MFSGLLLCFLNCYFVFYICICICNLLFCFQNCDLFCTSRPPYFSVSVRLSVFVFMSSDSETAGAVACSTQHNAAHSQRDTQNKQIIFFYIAVFLHFNNHRH